VKWLPDRTGRFSKRPHYLPDELDFECERVILAFLQKKYGKADFPIDTDDLTVLIEEQADLDAYADLSGEGHGVEGMTEFESGKRPLVKIADGLNVPHLENRLRTTMTHEYGHVHFHRFLFEEPSGRPDSLFGAPQICQGNKCHRDTIIAASERDWMEWQAGYVCGAILMPVGALVKTVQQFRQEHDLPFTNLSVQSAAGRKLITAVAGEFQTSADAARVRLLRKGVLLDMGRQTTESLF
jgi:hypothetical protein